MVTWRNAPLVFKRFHVKERDLYENNIQCTLDYPGADYSVFRLSVHESFFNLRHIWFTKSRIINLHTQYFFIKSGEFLSDSSPGVQAHRQWEMCDKSTFIGVCLPNGAVGVQNINFRLSVFLNYPCIPSPTISLDNRKSTVPHSRVSHQPRRAVGYQVSRLNQGWPTSISSRAKAENFQIFSAAHKFMALKVRGNLTQ
jgi:hypothetical protein